MIAAHCSYSFQRNALTNAARNRSFLSARSGYTCRVKLLPGTVHGKGDPFASTHWSVVLTAAQSDENTAASEAALSPLWQAYWAPL